MSKEDICIGMRVMAEIDGGHCSGTVEYVDDERCGIEFGDPIGYQVISVDDIAYKLEDKND